MYKFSYNTATVLVNQLTPYQTCREYSSICFIDLLHIWFQNRRSKFKRQRQQDHVTWMRKQIFQTSSNLNNGLMFGTPILPALTSACHVVSPLESQISRGDTASERPGLPHM